MNCLMLMRVDKQIHYYVILRYENEVEFLNKTWKNNLWTGVYNLPGNSLDTLMRITSIIKNHLVL